jgi:hypothetical protein
MKTSPLFAALLASVLLPLALVQPLSAQAQPASLLSITDPEGDDVGDGSLAYPRDSAFTAGDLDLRSLRVFADGNNLRFEATMRNNIRHPGTARGPGMGSEDLSVFARRGFYAFNLDIYVDTDRVVGSGNTVSLPGRRATIDPAHAWEKVIVLTPRPELMERMLSDALQEASPASAADIEATTQASVFFATDIRVRGRTVSFVVPGTFLDAQTLANSSITAMVTLAKLSVETEVSLFGKPSSNAIERLVLGVAQPEAGRPLFAMGYVGDRGPATSVVDMVTPDARQQAVQLGRGGVLTGLNRSNQFGLSQVLAVPAAPLAAAATSPTASPAASRGSWFSKALGSLAGLVGLEVVTAAPTAAAAPVKGAATQSMQSLMAPTAPVASPVAPAAGPARATVPAAAAAAPAAIVRGTPQTAAEKARPRDAAYFEEQEMRLRTLERLRKSGLITEAEYLQKRADVVEGL